MALANHRIVGAFTAQSVVLGSPTDPKSREYLAESIIAPSHRFAKPRAVYSGDPPLVLEEREYENIKEGELSRMGNFSESLTVREWLDIVEYLEKMQKRSLPLQ